MAFSGMRIQAWMIFLAIVTLLLILGPLLLIFSEEPSVRDSRCLAETTTACSLRGD